MRRQDYIQRAVGRADGPFLTGTPVPARAAQLNVAEGGSKAQRVIAFEGPWPTTLGTRSVPREVIGELLTNQLLLQTIEHRFRLFQPQPYVLDPFTRTLNGLDRHAEWRRVWRFDQDLDCEFHREPPRMTPVRAWQVL